MKRGYYYYIIPAVAAVAIVGVVGINAYLANVSIGSDQPAQPVLDDYLRMKEYEKIRRAGPCIGPFDSDKPVQTGRLTVFILPYTKMDACDAMNAIESIVGMRLRDDHRSGASLKGQYDNYGNILAPASTVNFVIDPTLKKPDGSPVRVEDLDEEFLFGNNLTVGGVGFKDGSGVGATILVVDSHYEDAIKAKLDDIRVALTGRS
ncbi:MAG: hypothetical protein NZ888_03810 [Candidatus Nitrosocaldus sp.]|nr:hypothetical protein [Candidatus Nitrosocaldus sp.]MDW8000258.1 hypothetical protein [Candidatus Nitrosocaldus sp.]